MAPTNPETLEQQWAGFLERARAIENWRTLHAVQQQSNLQHLVAVWPLICEGWRPPQLPPPKRFDAAWDRLWSPAFIERMTSEICIVLQWDWERARAVMLSAIHLRVIYPDGKTHAQADTYVQSVTTLQELEARAGKLRPTSTNMN